MSNLERFLVENMYIITDIIVVISIISVISMLILLYCTREKYDKEAMKIVKKYLNK